MRISKQLRPPVAVSLAGLLALAGLAAFACAQALAATTIYGSGAALQAQLQKNILILGFGPGPIKFTPTSSGAGFDELGDNTGTVSLGKDPEADGVLPSSQLDAYVATDSGPTAAQLQNASEASGVANEITVPVAQTPLDLLLSLPPRLTLSTKQSIDLGNLLAGQLFAGSVPPGGGFTKNTWGAFLADVGLTKTSSSPPPLGQFLDSGDGSKGISVEVRKNGAGTTLNLKQYAKLVDAADWSSIALDQNAYGTKEWPASADVLPAAVGNSSDADEVTAVVGDPGTVGYATQGDGAANNPPFTNKPLFSTKGSKHQILYALLQDNGTNTTGQKFGDPELGTKANVYTGSEIQVNSNGNGGVGNWIVPMKGIAFDPTGSWAGTQASDPDVIDHEADGVQYYPLVAVAFDLSWSNFSTATLTPDYTLPTPAAAQTLTQQFLKYATSTSGGQSAIRHGPDFYASLPSAIQSYAAEAAAVV